MSRRVAFGLLLLLAALLPVRAEASRASVWESNPPAAFSVARTEAASALASLAPAAASDIEAEDLPRFDLGDVALVERELEREEHFDLGPLTLVDLNLLRGPPPSYPETRVGGFELLPPFRIGASPSLSLCPRRACGAFSCGLASDSPEDPWGLMDSVAREKLRQAYAREMERRRAEGPSMSSGPTEQEARQAALMLEAHNEGNRIAQWGLAPTVISTEIAILGSPFVGSRAMEPAYVPRLSDAKPSLRPPAEAIAARQPAESPLPVVEHYSDAAPLPTTFTYTRNDKVYTIDKETGETVRAEGIITGRHPGRAKGPRPLPVGGLAASHERGHLIPENGVADPRDVNVRENMISEARRSNRGPKRRIENFASRLADQNPGSVVMMIAEPQRTTPGMVPFAVCHTVTVNGEPVRTDVIPNR